MAFNIILQHNKSEKNRINKTVDNIMTVTGELKTETSLIDPVILIEISMANATKINYLTVESFGRSYFVSGVKSVRRGLIEFTCHCDVLSSFKTEILANSGIVKKSEKNWNMYLDDGTFKVYQNPTVITKPFPYGFDTNSYVLAVSG